MNPAPPRPQAIWDRAPREAQDDILALAARVTALEATVQALLERLPLHAHPSSRPPSTDAPTRPRPRRPPRGRTPGGQVGQKGKTRTLVPVAEVAGLVPLTPGGCAHRQQPWRGTAVSPPRPQIVVRPPSTPVGTEYPLHQWVCPACSAVTRASWPPGGALCAYGPRVQAMTARCTGASRLSTRLPQGLLADRFGLPMRLGTLSTLAQARARPLPAPVTAARAPFLQHKTRTRCYL